MVPEHSLGRLFTPEPYPAGISPPGISRYTVLLTWDLGTVGLHHGIQSHGGLNPVWLRATALSYAEVAQKRQTLLTAVLWTGGKVATLNIQRNILGGI